jgi:hypothetical protein
MRYRPMFSAELARIIFDDRDREIRDELRLRALLASVEPAGERRPWKPVFRSASRPARSR